jgi:hypothetical protein
MPTLFQEVSVSNFTHWIWYLNKTKLLDTYFQNKCIKNNRDSKIDIKLNSLN